jgi:hypothetical protein
MALLIMAALVGAAVLAWRRRARMVALGLVGAAAVPLLMRSPWLPAPAWPALIALLAVGLWHHWTRTAATVSRWGARSRRKAGVASTLDIVRSASGWAMKRRAGTLRPSLGGLNVW